MNETQYLTIDYLQSLKWHPIGQMEFAHTYWGTVIRDKSENFWLVRPDQVTELENYRGLGEMFTRDKKRNLSALFPHVHKPTLRDRWLLIKKWVCNP